MGLSDWIFIGVAVLVLVLGSLIGFGKGLKFITGGIVGVIISVVLCYCFGGMILNIGFVQTMLADLSAKWSHITILNLIHLELIIFYVALFIIFSLARIILVKLFKNFAESDVLVIKIFNKVGGAILFLALAFLVMCLVFQVIQWIGGSTAEAFRGKIEMSGKILRYFYEHNPMAGLVDMVKGIFIPEQTAFVL